MILKKKVMVFLIIIVVLTGCATSQNYRAVPNIEDRAKSIKHVTIVLPQIDVYQLTAGGVKEKIDEWSAQARQNMLDTIKATFDKKPDVIVTILSEASLPPDLQTNIAETKSLYNAVNSSIITHTYMGTNKRFKEKIKNFDYSLGEELNALSDQTDVLLLITGMDNISSGGRQALNFGTIVAGALFGVFIIPPSGITAVSAALVDTRDGAIMWYNYKANAGNFDLRKSKSVDRFVKVLFKGFPI